MRIIQLFWYLSLLNDLSTTITGLCTIWVSKESFTVNFIDRESDEHEMIGNEIESDKYNEQETYQRF